MARPRGYVKVKPGVYKNVRKGSPRQGKTFRMGKKPGVHVYTVKGKPLAIGGKKPGAKGGPKKPRLNQRQRRERALNKNPLYQPAVPLVGSDLSKAADEITNLQYAPGIREFDREEGVTSRQGQALITRAGGYHNQLGDRQAQTSAMATALRERLTSSLSGLGQSTQGQLEGNQAEVKADRAADVELRGPGLEGSNQALTELAMARSRASEDSQGYQALGQLQNANYGGLMASNQQATGLRGIEARQQLENRLANAQSGIADRRRGFVADKGATRTKNLLSLRQDQFDNLAVVQGLKMNEAQLTASVQGEAADRQLKMRQEREDRRFTREESRRDRTARDRLNRVDEAGQDRRNDADNRTSILNDQYSPPSSRSPKSPFSNTQRRAGRQKFREGVGDFRTGSGKPPSDPVMRRAIEQYALNEKRYGRGFVSPKTRRSIRRDYGFTIKGSKPNRRQRTQRNRRTRRDLTRRAGLDGIF